MPRFYYEARDAAGARITGEINATNRGHALVLLRERGLAADALVDAARAARSRTASWGQGPLYPLWPMRPSAVALFFDQLGRLLSAGVTPHEAFNALQDRVGGRLRRVAREGPETFARGGSISSHLERYPRFFPPHLVAIFRAGERSGQYAEACREIVAQCDTETKTRRFVTLLKVYLIFMLVPCILVPSFPRIFSKTVLSNPEQMTVPQGLHEIWVYLHPGLQEYGRHVLFGILPWVLSAYLLAKAVTIVLHLPSLTPVRDRLTLYTPLLSMHTRRAAVARFARVLELMLHAGVPLGDAVREAARATGNRLVAQRVTAPAECLDRGGRLSEVLYASGIFSPSQVSQIVTAEESGALAEGLGRMAENARQSREQFLKGAGLGGCFTAFAIAAIFTLLAAIAGWTTLYDEILKVFDSSAWQP